MSSSLSRLNNQFSDLADPGSDKLKVTKKFQRKIYQSCKYRIAKSVRINPNVVKLYRPTLLYKLQ